MKHLTSDQLVSYHLNELSNHEKGILENHLQECSVCQNELIFIGEVHSEWMNPSSVEPTSNFLNGIMLGIEEQEATARKVNHLLKRNQSMKNRFVHLVIASAATFLVFQFQPTKHIVDSNQHVVQTIEQTSSLIEKGREIPISFSKFWKGDRH